MARSTSFPPQTTATMPRFQQVLCILTIIILAIVALITFKSYTVSVSIITPPQPRQYSVIQYSPVLANYTNTDPKSKDIIIMGIHFGRTVRKKGSKQKNISPTSDSTELRFQRVLEREEEEMRFETRMKEYRERFERNQIDIERAVQRKESLRSCSSHCHSSNASSWSEVSTVVVPLSVGSDITLKKSNFINHDPKTVECSSPDQSISSISNDTSISNSEYEENIKQLKRRIYYLEHNNKKMMKENKEINIKAVSYKKGMELMTERFEEEKRQKESAWNVGDKVKNRIVTFLLKCAYIATFFIIYMSL